MVIQLNFQMSQNIFRVEGHNQKLMIERTMDKRISPLPILTQDPKSSQYWINLLANDPYLILH